MKLFETTVSFAEVLALKPGQDNAVTHALTDLAWNRWHSAQPGLWKTYEEKAYVTIEAVASGYLVTIQVHTASINLQKARERYIARSGVACPVCQSGEIEGGHIEVDAGGASQPITCGNCGSVWIDRYSLVRIDDLIVHEGRK